MAKRILIKAKYTGAPDRYFQPGTEYNIFLTAHHDTNFMVYPNNTNTIASIKCYTNIQNFLDNWADFREINTNRFPEYLVEIGVTDTPHKKEDFL